MAYGKPSLKHRLGHFLLDGGQCPSTDCPSLAGYNTPPPQKNFWEGYQSGYEAAKEAFQDGQTVADIANELQKTIAQSPTAFNSTDDSVYHALMRIADEKRHA